MVLEVDWIGLHGFEHIYNVNVTLYHVRDAIYHSMYDRGVYLPDDYNSDAPPAQVKGNYTVLSW